MKKKDETLRFYNVLFFMNPFPLIPTYGFYTLLSISMIDPHAAMQHQMKMKILTQESFSTLAKG